MKYLTFFVIVASVFYLLFSNKKKYVVLLLILISSVSATMFRSEEVYLSLAAILIIIFSPFFLDDFKEGVGIFLLVTIMLTIWGLVVGIFNINEQYSLSHELSLEELINFSCLPLVSLLFFAITKNHINENGLNDIFLAMSFSVLLQLLSVLASTYGVNNIPDFLSSSVDQVPDIIDGQIIYFERYGGLVGDYELVVDYCMIVIAFSMLYGMRTRRFGYSILFSGLAIMLGALTGTRSLLFTIGFTFIVAAFLGMTFNKNKQQALKLIYSGGVAVAVLLTFKVFLGASEFAIIDRFSILVTAYADGVGVESLLNRNYSYAIDLIKHNVPIYGLGGFRFSDLLGSEIVSHNLIMSVVVRYGYFVACVALVAFGIFIRRLYVAVKYAQDDLVRWQLIIILSTTLSLFLQQMKVSAIRGSVGVILYTLWFTVSYFYLKNSKVLHGEQYSTFCSNVGVQR